MSKYGYNPDEHFQTKVTLIDKDGFHKESDEVPGEVPNEESSEGFNFEEGFILEINRKVVDEYSDQYANLLVIIDKDNHPDLFEYYDQHFNREIFYFGDAIDDSELHIDNEMYSVWYNNQNIGAISFGYDSSCPVFNEKYMLLTITRSKENSVEDLEIVDNLNDGDLAHLVLPYYPGENGSLTFIQLHGIVKITE